MPLGESAFIHERAMKSLFQDTIINKLQGRVVILLDENANIRVNHAAELAAERATTAELRIKLQAEEGISGSHERENKDLRKKNRSLKWQRNGAVLIGLVVIGLSL